MPRGEIQTGNKYPDLPKIDLSFQKADEMNELESPLVPDTSNSYGVNTPTRARKKRSLKHVGNKNVKDAKDELEFATNWRRSFI